MAEKIDIFSLEPNVVSKDLKGKIIALYGSVKSGKTSNACKFEKPLLIAFEKGFNAISGIKAQPINTWGNFKMVLKQLDNPKAKALYSTIIIDTVDIAYDLCEKFVCQREQVEKIADIPWGAGYKMLRQEFFSTLRNIAILDFGLIMISHSLERVSEQNGQQIIKTVSTLNDRAKDIVFGMADIVGYSRVEIDESTGHNKMMLYLRETPYWEAGSRFAYTPTVIDFTYDALASCIAEAIAEEERISGIQAVEKKASAYQDVETYDFDNLMSNIKTTYEELIAKQDCLHMINEIVESHLGKGKKLNQCTKEQVEMIALILDDLKDLLQSMK